jgi:hypothetical protein
MVLTTASATGNDGETKKSYEGNSTKAFRGCDGTFRLKCQWLYCPSYHTSASFVA